MDQRKSCGHSVMENDLVEQITMIWPCHEDIQELCGTKSNRNGSERTLKGQHQERSQGKRSREQ